MISLLEIMGKRDKINLYHKNIGKNNNKRRRCLICQDHPNCKNIHHYRLAILRLDRLSPHHFCCRIFFLNFFKKVKKKAYLRIYKSPLHNIIHLAIILFLSLCSRIRWDQSYYPVMRFESSSPQTLIPPLIMKTNQ